MRWGGWAATEFAVFLPHTQDEVFARLLQQLCDAIAARMAEVGFPVTASIGHLGFALPPDGASVAM